jgi:type IV pilus assembly protein PilA
MLSSRRRSLRSPRSPGSEGFTLMELLISIAIISTMSALGIAMFQKYVHAAQSGEARTVIGQIRSGEESYKAEMLQYLSCSASLTDYYPNATPDDSRWAWRRPTDARYANGTQGWQMLNVNPDGPVRYGYAAFAGMGPTAPPGPDPGFVRPPILFATPAGVPWFVIAAKNKHISTMGPSLAITTSYDGTLYFEGDSE